MIQRALIMEHAGLSLMVSVAAGLATLRIDAMLARALLSGLRVPRHIIVVLL
jgi:hypothetical protein